MQCNEQSFMQRESLSGLLGNVNVEKVRARRDAHGLHFIVLTGFFLDEKKTEKRKDQAYEQEIFFTNLNHLSAGNETERPKPP